MAHALRPARRTEASRLLEIEDDAGRLYARAGLPPDLEGLELAFIDAAIAAGTVWVATDDDDLAIGFALCLIFPGALHLRELDVATTHMRRGLGRRLVDHACARAASLGLARVTLTTFVEVPWNRPLYERWGFAVVAPGEQPAWLADIRAHEDRGELRRWPRCAMAKPANAEVTSRRSPSPR